VEEVARAATCEIQRSIVIATLILECVDHRFEPSHWTAHAVIGLLP
jgi:hypothetical protein